MGLFTIEINGRAIAVIGDAGRDEVETYRDDEEFQQDLMELETDDGPLWDGESEISVREAFPEESERWLEAHLAASNDGELEEDDDLVVWLVEVNDPTDDDLEEDETDDGQRGH